jgi:lipopolysaccharide transport system permease protein
MSTTLDQIEAPAADDRAGELSSLPTSVIRAGAGPLGIDLRELWRYRELAAILALRDIQVRYKQTVLGVAWAVLQPVATMLVFSVIFGYLARIPSDGVPYPVFAFAALLPWQLFAYALTQSSNSIIENERLITKVYFPRLLIPLASVLAGLLDFAIAFVVLLGLMAWYQTTPTWAVVWLPLFTLLAVVAALAVGLWLAALNALYRDFRYTIPFLTQLWMFASPIAYPASLVPEQWRWLYGLNPMVGVIEGFRWALLGSAPPSLVMLAVSVVATLMFFFTGAMYFRRMERTFADWV